MSKEKFINLKLEKENLNKENIKIEDLSSLIKEIDTLTDNKYYFFSIENIEKGVEIKFKLK